jgi:hypothetical protein
MNPPFDWMPKVEPTTRAQVFRMLGTFCLMFLLCMAFTDHMLKLAVVVVFLIDLWSGVLLVKQRALIARQHKQVMDMIALSNDVVGRYACSQWNLQRARAELERAGIEFAVLMPPAAAVDKESLS